MKIKLKEILVSDVVTNYVNNNEEGVIGWNGKLNIRPIYQREFIYKDKQRDSVIKTVRQNFPLNSMYWIKNSVGTYEIIDGQQRTISICEYISGRFAINYQKFFNLEKEEKEQILNYKLMVYFCEGDDKEKLDWFKTINIAGAKLSNQELRNALYTGPWLTDAKKYFSKSNCPAKDFAADYMKGSPINQDYLETVIGWISNGQIEKFMSEHQYKPNANELWLYFQSVINWVKVIFPNYRRIMKGLPFGSLYNDFSYMELDSKKIEKEIVSLLLDEDIIKKSGIYLYILTRDEKYLNLRSFSEKQKIEAYEKQKGICVRCGEYFELEEMEADHITPWSEGGKTDSVNCQMLCKHDNRIKSNK